jgi:hypothetical protein
MLEMIRITSSLIQMLNNSRRLEGEIRNLEAGNRILEGDIRNLEARI